MLKQFPDYGSIKDEMHVRITELPILDKLRDLREVRQLPCLASETLTKTKKIELRVQCSPVSWSSCN